MMHSDNDCDLCANIRRISAALFRDTPTEESLLGKQGMATFKIKPGKLGEVRLPYGGGTDDFLAVTAHPDEEIEAYAPIEVVGNLTNRTLVVRGISKS